MKKPKKLRKKVSGYLVQCLRCNRRSRVHLVAKCGHCGSFAVRMLDEEKRKDQ